MKLKFETRNSKLERTATLVACNATADKRWPAWLWISAYAGMTCLEIFGSRISILTSDF